MAKIAERGPVKGAPPTLEWIGLDQLQIDRAYQRRTDGAKSRAILFAMFKAWDWSLCQPLVVSRREGGGLFVIDGQHRLEGARQRGDVPHLPCVVLNGAGGEGEAMTFVNLNMARQQLSQADIFAAQLASNDEDALRIQRLLKRTGWRQVRGQDRKKWKPGDLFCAPMLVRQLKVYRESVIANALTALREAYPDQVVRNTANMLQALFAIYGDSTLQGEDPDLFIEAIGNIPEDDWRDHVRKQQQASPLLSGREALGAAFMAAYRRLADKRNAA